MKHIFDRLEQLARERLLTRLKHLRGQHDQRDHAWNRGMGVGGGAVELGPNQMGPLPTMQMYRQQQTALMDQYRRGEITRQEMRQQSALLRGITATPNSETTSSNELILKRLRKKSIDLKNENWSLISKSHQITLNKDDLNRNFALDIYNKMHLPIVKLVVPALIDVALEQQVQNYNNRHENAPINIDIVKNILATDKSNDIIKDMHQKNVGFDALVDLMEAFNNGVNDKIPANAYYHYENLTFALFIYASRSGMYSVARDADLDNVLKLMRNLSNQTSPSDFLSIFPKIIQSIKDIPSKHQSQIDIEKLNEIEQTTNDEIAKFNEKMENDAREQTSIKVKIEKNRKETLKINEKIKKIKADDVNSGNAVIIKLYNDPESQEYFDPTLVPESVKPFIDTHVELGELIAQNQKIIDIMKSSFGLDAGNPEHVQIIGDILGVFHDGTSNNRAVIENDLYNLDELNTRITNYGDGKEVIISRSMKYDPNSKMIIIDNDYFKQENMPGIGRTALMRQIPAAIKLSRLSGVPVKIKANAVSDDASGFVGYAVWPKMSFNFGMNSDVYLILKEFGFTDAELTDTFTFMQSSKKAKSSNGAYTKKYKLQSLDGKSPMEIWSAVVDAAVQDGGDISVKGSSIIDATNPDIPPVTTGLMMKYYLDYLRNKNSSKSMKAKNNNSAYEKYVDSIGFTMEDMDAFASAWEMIRRTGAKIQ